ncbi:aromatic amino acid lyase, partial [Bacillus sp. S34]|nr:aromatic amino acid lyase [Bacillus sp. S34]
LEGSAIAELHRDHRVQDPYLLRALPQLHGSVRRSFDDAARIVDESLGSVGDNPLLFPEDGDAVRALRRLGRNDQEIITLSILEGYSEREIADALGIAIVAFFFVRNGVLLGLPGWVWVLGSVALAGWVLRGDPAGGGRRRARRRSARARPRRSCSRCAARSPPPRSSRSRRRPARRTR